MNYWFWLYLFAIPGIVFAVGLNAPKWLRAVRVIVAIALGHALLFLGTLHYWDVRAQALDAIPHQTLEQANSLTSSGANIAFILFFGWIPAAMYVGWWQMIWQRYYINTVKHLNGFKYTIIEKGICIISILFSIIFFTYVIILAYAIYAS